MAWSVTLAGETFTDANVAGTAYADEATGFPAILAAFAREAAFLQGLSATSATSMAAAVGPVVLATHQDASAVGLSPGMLVRAASAADPGTLMVGTVTGFAGTALALQVLFAAGGEAADWVITRPTGGTSLVMDPSPALAADLEAGGHSIHGLLELTVGGAASFAAAGESRAGYLGSVTGEVPVRATDPTTIACTLAGDTTFLVHGARTPGAEHAHRIRATVGGAGGWSVSVLPASLLTNSNDLSDTAIDSGWNLTNVTATSGALSPAGAAWTIAAAGTGQHFFQSRRAASAAPHRYVGAALLKAAGTGRVRLRVRLDTLGYGAHVEADLAAGTLGTPVPSIATVLGSGRRALVDGWTLLWLAVDVATAGYGLMLEVTVLDATGGDTYAAAGESLLFGGATLSAGETYQGFQHLGPSRQAAVLWQGVPVDWPVQPAGAAIDLMLQCDPDRIIQQDYTPEEM